MKESSGTKAVLGKSSIKEKKSIDGAFSPPKLTNVSHHKSPDKTTMPLSP
jgi:hypothetical protein